MTAFRAIAFSALAAAAFVVLTAPAGSSNTAPGCGPAIEIRDPGLRASFAKFDAGQSDAATKVCVLYRNAAFN